MVYSCVNMLMCIFQTSKCTRKLVYLRYISSECFIVYTISSVFHSLLFAFSINGFSYVWPESRLHLGFSMRHRVLNRCPNDANERTGFTVLLLKQLLYENEHIIRIGIRCPARCSNENIIFDCACLKVNILTSTQNQNQDIIEDFKSNSEITNSYVQS